MRNIVIWNHRLSLKQRIVTFLFGCSTQPRTSSFPIFFTYFLIAVRRISMQASALITFLKSPVQQTHPKEILFQERNKLLLMCTVGFPTEKSSLGFRTSAKLTWFPKILSCQSKIYIHYIYKQYGMKNSKFYQNIITRISRLDVITHKIGKVNH